MNWKRNIRFLNGYAFLLDPASNEEQFKWHYVAGNSGGVVISLFMALFFQALCYVFFQMTMCEEKDTNTLAAAYDFCPLFGVRYEHSDRTKNGNDVRIAVLCFLCYDERGNETKGLHAMQGDGRGSGRSSEVSEGRNHELS